MKNELIIKAFLNNQPARNKNLKTNGQNLYSYNLLIGRTTPQGRKEVFNYTAPGGDFRSHTTSKHIGLAREAGISIIDIPKS